MLWCCSSPGDTMASLSMEILLYISSRLLPTSPLQQSHRVQEVQVPQGGLQALGDQLSGGPLCMGPGFDSLKGDRKKNTEPRSTHTCSWQQGRVGSQFPPPPGLRFPSPPIPQHTPSSPSRASTAIYPC